MASHPHTMLNVQIVSRETIKPSSATKENLRYLQLSLIDQLAPTIHIPLILFYSSCVTAGQAINLKKYLSEVLTVYYPLAGRIREDDETGFIHVECNDEGAEFYEARVDGELSEFLQRPSIDELNRLLPHGASEDVPLLIQFSVFNGGGWVIGVSLSHRLADGNSLAMFINSWADMTRTSGDIHKVVNPTFGFASLFPPRTMKGKIQEVQTLDKKVVAKRLVFEQSNIALMREKVSTHADFIPTRVEAVSALIWRCILKARQKVVQENKPVAAQAVNIRRSFHPLLQENSFGNLWLLAFATDEQIVSDHGGHRVGYLEERFREAIGKMKDDHHIREALENDEMMDLYKSSCNIFAEKWETHGFDFCVFSSWCRFPFYESDFGWGKPEWLTFLDVPVKNVVVLASTRDGNGIEAWVLLVEEEMAKFEQDPNLMAFVSFSH